MKSYFFSMIAPFFSHEMPLALQTPLDALGIQNYRKDFFLQAKTLLRSTSPPAPAPVCHGAFLSNAYFPVYLFSQLSLPT